MDGAAPAQIGRVPFAGCTFNYECGLTWSPDGTRIGFGKVEGKDSAFDADAPGAVERIDELTYRSWAGGGYSCEC